MFTVFLKVLAVSGVISFLILMQRVVFWAGLLAVFALAGHAAALTLQGALELALKQNHSVATLQSRVIESQTKVGTARTAYLPQFQLSGSYTYNSRLPKLAINLPLPIEFPEIQTATHHVVDTRLQGGYLLLDFGKRRKAVSMAVLGREMSETALAGTQDDVAYQVTREYVTAAMIAERARLAERYVATSQRHLDDARVLFDNGLVSQFDLLKSEMQVKVYQEQLAVATAELRSAQLSLAESIGLDNTALPEIAQSLAELVVTAPETTAPEVERLAMQKPEVIALRKQQEVSQLTIGLEQLRPSLSLVSFVGWKNSYLPDPDKLLFNYSGGAVVSYPIFDGGRARARRAEEIERQRTLDLEIEQIVSRTTTAVETLRAETDKISAKSRITEERLVLARKALEIAAVSFSTGLITNSDYLDTELEVQQIETDALTDRYSLLVAHLELKRVLSYWPELVR